MGYVTGGSNKSGVGNSLEPRSRVGNSRAWPAIANEMRSWTGPSEKISRVVASTGTGSYEVAGRVTSLPTEKSTLAQPHGQRPTTEALVPALEAPRLREVRRKQIVEGIPL